MDQFDMDKIIKVKSEIENTNYRLNYLRPLVDKWKKNPFQQVITINTSVCGHTINFIMDEAMEILKFIVFLMERRLTKLLEKLETLLKLEIK